MAVRVRRRTVRLAGAADDIEANTNSPYRSLAARAGTANMFILCQPRGQPWLLASEGIAFRPLVRPTCGRRCEANMKLHSGPVCPHLATSG